MNDYQQRLDSIVEMFGKPDSGDNSDYIDAEKYRNKLPNSMIEFWKQNGIGIILNGYFQFCEPARYSPILAQIFENDPDLKHDRTHAIGFGAFGKLLCWNEDFKHVIVDLINGYVSCRGLINSDKAVSDDADMTSQLMTLDEAFLDEYNAKATKLFKPALSKLGKVEMGQIYGFKPILALGGFRSLDNLVIYEARSHMSILAQAKRPQLMDYSIFPPKPVRPIG